MPTLAINLLHSRVSNKIYCWWWQFWKLLIAVFQRWVGLIEKRMFLKLIKSWSLIFPVSSCSTEWMLPSWSIHSLSKLSFYKIDWTLYNQTCSSNWDSENSKYGRFGDDRNLEHDCPHLFWRKCLYFFQKSILSLVKS